MWSAGLNIAICGYSFETVCFNIYSIAMPYTVSALLQTQFFVFLQLGGQTYFQTYYLHW